MIDGHKIPESDWKRQEVLVRNFISIQLLEIKEEVERVAYIRVLKDEGYKIFKEHMSGKNVSTLSYFGMVIILGKIRQEILRDGEEEFYDNMIIRTLTIDPEEEADIQATLLMNKMKGEA